MLKGIRTDQPFTVELDEDPGKGTEDATQFIVSQLPNRLIGSLRDMHTSVRGKAGSDNPDDVTIDISGNALQYDVVRFGVHNIVNFLDADGEPVEVKLKKDSVRGRQYPCLPNAIMDMLDPRWITELSKAILGSSEVTEDEGKNSD